MTVSIADEKSKIALTFLKCLEHREPFERMQPLITADFVWKTGRGQEIQTILPALLRTLWQNVEKGFEMRFHGVTAGGDRVAIEAECYVPLKNRTVYNNFYHFLLVLRDGKVAAVIEHCDTLHAQQILGSVLANAKSD